MTDVTVPYGRGQLHFQLPRECQVESLAPPAAVPAPDPAQAVEAALDAPRGGVRLEDFAGARSAVLVVNDKTRPVPHALLLPPLLRRLEALGIPASRITILIATGLHAPMAPSEFPAILPPEVIARYRVLSHNAQDTGNLVDLGQTSRGTPVWVNRRFWETDLRVVTGNIEPHQFQGFSGGVKTAAIGLAGPATINHNHSFMLDPAAGLGEFDRNPARQDVEEIGQRIGVHFALNAILNGKKEIVHALAGDPAAVMREGILLSRQACQVEVSAPFDLIFASPGGHPKDINLYQSQKGFAHARLATREGGTIVLAAACPEGTGSAAYEQWMEGMTSYEAVFERFRREGFQIGKHKAFQIARDAAQVQLLTITEMPADFVRRLLLNPVAGPEEAVALALARLPLAARIGVMPIANATIPVLAHN